MDQKNFQKEKKAHWQSYDLRDKDEEVKEMQKAEFFTSPDPLIARIKSGEFDRKSFLKLMGAGVAMTSLNCIRKPVEKIVPYVDLSKTDENAQYDFVKHGHSYYYASVFAGTGILVKARDGRPLKLEGNPDHPVSQGALGAAGQAAIFDLYDPDRSQNPAIINGGIPVKSDWTTVDAKVKAALAANKGKTVVVTKPLDSPSTKSIIGDFLRNVGGGKHYEISLTSAEEVVSKGQAASYGKALIPNYHFDLANVILSIDCDFMGNWLSPEEHQKDFSKRRNLRNGAKDVNFYVAAESIPTMSGSNADLRLPIRPGDQTKLALAIILALEELGAAVSSFGFDGNVVPLVGYGKDDAEYDGPVRKANLNQLASSLGVSEESIRKTAKALWSNKGKSLVVAGSLAASTKDAVELQVLVNLLNSVLENDGKTIDHANPKKEGLADYSNNLNSLASELKQTKVGVLFVNDVNLVYQAGEEWKNLLHQAALVVALTDRADETALASNVLATTTHFLESWGDAEVTKGIFSIQQPAIRPLFHSRSFEDSLIAFAGGSLGGESSFYEYVKNVWIKKLGSKQRWEDLLRAGTTLKASERKKVAGSSRNFNRSALKRIESAPAGLKLALYETSSIGDGKAANNAQLQELPDPVTKVTWDNYILISPALAKEKKISSNDVLVLKTATRTIELPAQIQPGMHKEAIGIAVGYGRTAVGAVGNGVGKNAYVLSEKGVYSGITITSLEKTGKTYKLACTQHHHMLSPGFSYPDRPLVQSTTIEEYRKDPASGKAPSEIPKILKDGKLVSATGANPVYAYPGYKWGMSIDLSSCTGCGSCVIACQVENNIPAVGRDEVRVGREMHWLRIDRYYIGDPDRPETLQVAHQPMLCQHCDNAPCETVCPVLATVHSSEGINDMVYNRCVGTRYCSNNCPYKVRRFNWMQHWYNGAEGSKAPRYLGLNPEVAVRGRGVMEKCNFCSHRIAEAKIAAKNEGRVLKDGEVKTACQQSCAADAISFGNTNDKDAEVAKLSSSPRSYRVLEYLNVGPQVAYLTRVRSSI
ncbi:TAT-variant-translocated molybdopterin oxidoreductase [Leptospira santarosai]|uniref:Fe-S-cluster-containing hydrogenase n=1 Tax=Leptospira santarosai serovar Shermani str. LT 821 TaxID=758847 RepID=K8Y6M2_9LEPT|nr:TAT-variant-translocated molybdopterin oxidoreductase [Leptospira santarosai]EKT88586.1 Fe-S-cluster-containing hydrogenase [Leptospira santarosai serovar Shermani str. LT 821]EMJ47267.1 4Fe-4S dicluster domain protein [Leptospira santarosai str. HAI1349]EMO23104.1 4Fe-4S dicluster domain protein [Leptospira santarosai str. HAI134]EPG82271.1 4Fe-4S dicluster domain protein [Leptospira santarosai serovar Shermani str. 1342KT]MDI7182213.1 TAT-variant-translocated molybdopterin oxidoreductase 